MSWTSFVAYFRLATGDTESTDKPQASPNGTIEEHCRTKGKSLSKYVNIKRKGGSSRRHRDATISRPTPRMVCTYSSTSTHVEPRTAHLPSGQPPLRYYYVDEDEIHIYAGPALDSPTLGTRTRGAVVAVAWRNGPWGKLGGPDPRGWVITDGPIIGMGHQLRPATDDDIVRAAALMRDCTRLENTFQFYDTNNDGELDENQLHCAMLEAGADLDADETTALLDKFGQGPREKQTINFQGFVRAFCTHRAGE